MPPEELLLEVELLLELLEEVELLLEEEELELLEELLFEPPPPPPPPPHACNKNRIKHKENLTAYRDKFISCWPR